MWKQFLGREILPVDDFIQISGIDIRKHKAFFRQEHFQSGVDYNGFGWKIDKKQFKAEHGLDFGEDTIFMYLYESGVKKAIQLLEQDKKIQIKPEVKELLNRTESKKQPPKELTSIQAKEPLKITIILDREFLNDCVAGKVGL